MVRLQAEAGNRVQLLSDRVEEVMGEVDHQAAQAALCVHVPLIGLGPGEVVDGGAVTQMHMGDEPELCQCLERAIDRRKVQTGGPSLDVGRDLFHGWVSATAGERADNRPSGGGDAVPAGAEPVEHVLDDRGDLCWVA